MSGKENRLRWKKPKAWFSAVLRWKGHRDFCKRCKNCWKFEYLELKQDQERANTQVNREDIISLHVCTFV